MNAHTPTQPSALRTAGINLAKLSAAGLTIFAAAALMLVTSPSGEVTRAEADIAMLNFAPRTPDQEFSEALKKLGHEPPRVYDYNGNTVYFSTNISRKRPDELLRDYQEEFVRQGVNEHIFSEKEQFNGDSILIDDFSPKGVDDPKTRLMESVLTGQMVPAEVSEDRMVMLGAMMEGRATDRAKFRTLMEQKAKSGKKDLFANIFKSFRFIQADWDEEQKVSFVTATWGDETFDIRKTLPVSEGGILEGTNPDPEIPSCPGCERLTRFAGTSDEAPFISHVFASTQHPNSVLSFYQRALAQRGWTETEGSSLLQKALPNIEFKGKNNISRQFTRNKTEFLTLTVRQDSQDNKTYVSLQNSN
jgi:hypothetical protein